MVALLQQMGSSVVVVVAVVKMVTSTVNFWAPLAVPPQGRRLLLLLLMLGLLRPLRPMLPERVMAGLVLVLVMLAVPAYWVEGKESCCAAWAAHLGVVLMKTGFEPAPSPQTRAPLLLAQVVNLVTVTRLAC